MPGNAAETAELHQSVAHRTYLLRCFGNELIKGVAIDAHYDEPISSEDLNRPGFNGDPVYVISANSSGRLAPA